jgi:hypothetical protein
MVSVAQSANANDRRFVDQHVLENAGPAGIYRQKEPAHNWIAA